LARIRTIKPEFWTNEKIMSCGTVTRLLFIGMWNFADDYGRMEYAPLSIKAKIFPNDNFSVSEIKDMLNELCSNGLLLLYSAKDKEFIEITGWDHQKIDKRQASKIPGPFEEGSSVKRGNSPTPADPRRPPPTPAPVMEGNGKERKVKDSEANASGAEAPRDVRSRLFTDGLSTLARLTGKGPDACRSFVGKCLKAASDDAVTVLGLIEDADRNRVVDPSAWISARLKSTGPPGISARPLTESQRKQAETNDVRAQLRDLANGRESSRNADRILSVDHGERPEDLRGGTGSVVLALPRASGS